LDKNYQGKYTSFIRGLAYGANGFYHPTLPRIKSPEDFQAYATQAKDFVVKADQRVLSGDFLIQPLVYKGKFDACQFCQFRDVCYRPDSAQKRISKTAADDDETGDDGDEEDEL
jgi:ATP-dependent helicase/DNAse subunit B